MFRRLSCLLILFPDTPIAIRLVWIVFVSVVFGFGLFSYIDHESVAAEKLAPSPQGLEQVLPSVVATEKNTVGQPIELSGYRLRAIAGERSQQKASAYCASLGMQLPAAEVLKTLWREKTKIRPKTGELCTVFGWPLYKLCNGNNQYQGEYWAGEGDVSVDMTSGQEQARLADASLHVACSAKL